MTDFDPNCEHGHQTRSGLPRKIVAMLDEPLGDGETIIAVGPTLNGFNSSWDYFHNGHYLSANVHDDRDLINAPAPKRTFKRWYVLVEWDIGGFTDVSFTDKHEAKQYSVASGKIIARYECEIPEGTGLDEQPEPEEPKTVKVDCWMSVYGANDGIVHTSKESADRHPAKNFRLACIHIERDVTVGEGIDD